MCIICVSSKGAPQPTTDQIKTMFARNPHGAGYMVAKDGHVEIHKGFIDLDDLTRQLRAESFTPDDPVVYHFRISTQAGVSPAMTHPFPLTDQLSAMQALDVTCPCGVAHNGVIPLTADPGEKTYSDTALFIAQYLTRLIRTPDDLKDASVLDMIYRLACSRFAILDASGYVATVGDFIKLDNGLLFSNNTFIPASAFYTPRRKNARKGKDVLHL